MNGENLFMLRNLKQKALELGWFPTEVEYRTYEYGDLVGECVWEFHDKSGDCIDHSFFGVEVGYSEEELLLKNAKAIEKEIKRRSGKVYWT